MACLDSKCNLQAETEPQIRTMNNDVAYEVAGSTSSIVSSVERQRGRQNNDSRSQLMMKLALRRSSDCSAAASCLHAVTKDKEKEIDVSKNVCLKELLQILRCLLLDWSWGLPTVVWKGL